MKLSKIGVAALFSVLMISCGSPKDEEEETPQQPAKNSAEFDAKVAPVFAKICTRCHTPTSGLPTGFLTSEAAAKGKALAKIKAGEMPKGAANQTEFAPFKAEIITILSK